MLKRFVVLFVLSVSFLLASCQPKQNPRPDFPTPSIESPLLPTSAETETPADSHPTLTPVEPLRGSQDNPAPLGSLATLGFFDLRIDAITRPATEQILKASSLNLVPDYGQEYIAIRLIVICHAPAQTDCYIRMTDMHLTGSSGVVRKPATVYGLLAAFWNRHMPGGYSVSGTVVFIVDQDEENLVYYYEEDSGSSIFLAAE